MEFIIGGDLVPTESNINLFNNSNVKELLGEELSLVWNAADYRIFNLEVPITNEWNPILKMGPNLIAPNSTVNGIKALKPSLITLANNHILDQGEEGLKNTQNLLIQNGIPFIGVGANLFMARKPYVFEKDNIKVGIYNCADYEFTIATENRPGANPFDPLESLDHITQLKNECQFVIVIYHGGKEHYRYPSPYLQKVCRKMAQKGADLVICQHSHCIGCYETYEDSTIIYGQGNFIFDRSESEYWKTSILTRVVIDDKLNIDYVPIIKSKNCIRLAEGNKGKEILNDFRHRSEEILKTNFIEQNYSILVEEVSEVYLRKLFGTGKWISRLDRYLFKGALLKKKYKKSDLIAIKNYIECEAHREIMVEILSKLSKASDK